MTVETMNDPEVLKEFLEESNNLLENVVRDLVSLESDPQNKELFNRIFRGCSYQQRQFKLSGVQAESTIVKRHCLNKAMEFFNPIPMAGQCP